MTFGSFLLADRITKLVSLRFSRVSVINGAQTISSLSRSLSDGADLTNADIHLRIISLVNTPDSLAVDITTANNTQNDLSPVDFVASDVNQDRLRRECASFGKIYSYRRGEAEPSPADGFTIREATIALACASGELRLAVAAKRYISGLWRTRRKSHTLACSMIELMQEQCGTLFKSCVS